MKKLSFLVLILLSMPALSETELLVEKKGQQVHFVYPDLEADNAYYYAMWTNKKNNCDSFFTLNAQPLLLKDARDNFYNLPKEKGHLCLRRSEELLSYDWNKYQITPDNKFLIRETSNSRSIDIAPPENLPPETNNLLPCEFSLKGDKYICELPL